MEGLVTLDSVVKYLVDSGMKKVTGVLQVNDKPYEAAVYFIGDRIRIDLIPR